MESYCCFVVKGKCLQLEGKVKAVLDIEGRAAGTMDDFIHGRQGALWMTSSMDAIEGGKQSVLVLVQLKGKVKAVPVGTCK
jgi:phage tail tube protein FII